MPFARRVSDFIKISKTHFQPRSSGMLPTLLSQLSTEDELAILKGFFSDGQNCPDTRSFRAFLNFYREEVRQFDFGVLPALLRDHGNVIRSHQDVIYIAEILRLNQDKTRADVRSLLNGHQRHFESVQNDNINVAIDLTLRLWLMLNVRSPESKLVMPLNPSIQWNDTKTLREFVAQQFSKEKLHLEPKDCRLSHLFTASFMVKVCGLKLEFTSRLENHLCLVRRHKKLLIYPYKACLMGYMQKWAIPSLCESHVS